jgi:MoaA/NifB/PqqE/SkfB family radical SAM enzyme
MSRIVLDKAGRVIVRKLDALVGRVIPLQPVLDAMTARPYELHLELTNLCNANCVFCPYQFQTRDVAFMPYEVFEKALADFADTGGGSVGLTPIVGDALIHPQFVEYVRALRAEPSVDRIFVTTNGILLDKAGIDEVLTAGLTAITISTAGFDRAMYERVYRSKSYRRMRDNVLALLTRNRELGSPVCISIGLRSDRPLAEVLRDPDMQPILEFRPGIDFTWSFTSAGGRITRENLPAAMRLRVVTSRHEPCVQLYNGPMVLPDGVVIACGCVASMDALGDLAIGSVLEDDLGEVWRRHELQRIRDSFGTSVLNATCRTCDMYRDLELYRTAEGRRRASISRRRARGEAVRREDVSRGAFAGG